MQKGCHHGHQRRLKPASAKNTGESGVCSKCGVIDCSRNTFCRISLHGTYQVTGTDPFLNTP